MNSLHKLRLRFRALFQKQKLDAQMDDEMRSHIEMQTQENIDFGMHPDEAHYAALRQFGWIESIKETCRDQRGVSWLENLGRDLRYEVRQMLKNPGFTTVAVLTLTLGVGVNLALFAMLNELMLRPKPVANPDELWAIEPATTAGQPIGFAVSRAYYEAIRQRPGAFKRVIGYAGIMPKLRTEEGAEIVYAELVSDDYFSFLGVTPALGRGFLLEEDAKPGTHNVAVISHAFWQSQFGGAANVIGSNVTLNGKVVEIVGVAPREFAGLDFMQPVLWIPTSMEKLLDPHPNYRFVGRLGDQAQAETARVALAPVVSEITSRGMIPGYESYGYASLFQGVHLEPIGRGSLGVASNRKEILDFLKGAGIATVLLLLIAGANVASLFLARALQRRKEMATRLALGATRGALVRQLVGEGILIAALGTAGAVLAFSWIGGTITQFASWWRGPALHPVFDLRLFIFAAVSLLLVGIGFSLFPALSATNFQPFSSLKDAEGADGSDRKRAWLRHTLIVAQIVGSLMLLCGATLCLRSISKQLAVDVGFRSDRLAIAPLNLERIGFTTNTVAAQLAGIAHRISLIPGVEQVGLSTSEPLSGRYSNVGPGELEGYENPEPGPILFDYAEVGPDVFAALGIPVLRGHEIGHTDIELDRRIALVNESFVNKFWPGQEPLGKRVQSLDVEVVGVVKDVRYSRFVTAPKPMMFTMRWKEGLLHPYLLIRAKRDPRQVISGVRAELARIHPKLLQGEICTLRDTMKNALGIQHTALRILGILGGLALTLSVIGTYGVMAYLVTRRTREIGLRIALGATRGAVMKLILTAGLRLGFIALAIGLPLAIGAAGILRHQLAGISPFDPPSFIVVASCVLIALICACWFPARRAAKVEPMETLRYE
jgi:predicted permease